MTERCVEKVRAAEKAVFVISFCRKLNSFREVFKKNKWGDLVVFSMSLKEVLEVSILFYLVIMMLLYFIASKVSCFFYVSKLKKILGLSPYFEIGQFPSIRGIMALLFSKKTKSDFLNDDIYKVFDNIDKGVQYRVFTRAYIKSIIEDASKQGKIKIIEEPEFFAKRRATIEKLMYFNFKNLLRKKSFYKIVFEKC